MKTHELREQRAARVAEMRRLLSTAETEKRQLNENEKARFDELKGAIVDLEAQEQRAAFLEQAERGAPVDKPLAAVESRISIMDVLRAQMEGRSVDGAAREYSQEVERRTGRKASGVFVPMGLLERRDEPAVNTTGTAPEIVPTTHRPDLYIGPLREALVARQLGVRTLTGLSGSLSIPRYGAGLETGWIAENSPVPDGEMAFDSVTLSPKHVGGKAEMSRQLLQQSSPDIEALVRSDLAFLIAKQIDRAIIAGTGQNDEPLGVLNAPNIQSASLASLDWLSIMQMVQQLEDEEITGGTWLTTASVKTLLATTLKQDLLPGYLLENGRMAGRALRTTRHLEDTSTGAPVLLGDWSQVLLGVWSELDLLVNPFAEPSYSRGGVQVRAMATVGLAIRHEQAFVLADDIDDDHTSSSI